MTAPFSERFESIFGRAPAASGSAPGRVNLIGEHIDYNGGTVLPTAIENSVNVWLAPNDGADLRVRSDRYEGTFERAVEKMKSDHWSDYIAGSVAKARELGWADGGFDVLVDSTVPSGGISSSAALCTAVLRALMAHAGTDMDPKRLALKAREVENDYIGVPCGIMDQMAVGLSVFGEALALDTRTLDYDVIAIPDGWKFVTLHSGVHRQLTDGRYQARFEECEEAAKRLGVEYLCDGPTNNALPDNLAARTRHVVSEHQRVLRAIAAMKEAKFSIFAEEMNDSHRSYSEDFEASTPVIDAMLADARQLGAAGARLTGGGFGGCVVLLTEAEQERDLVSALIARYRQVTRV